MNINSLQPNTQAVNSPLKNNPKAGSNEKTEEKTADKPVDRYTPSEKETPVTYKKPSNKPDMKTIEALKAESEKAHENLRDLVRRLLERQGVTMDDVLKGKKEFVVDDEARAEAAAAIADDGPLGAEKTSDRIVDFAKAISGGDKSKFDLLKNSIKEGFEAAKKALGGELPEVSQRTYDLVMEKLDNWKNEE